MKTILAPVDFSSATEAVVEAAATLASGLGGRVVLVTIVQPPVAVTEYMAMLNITEFVASSEQAADRQLEAIAQPLRTRNIPVTTIRETKPVVPAIIENARSFQADYIVMGSHGHTAFYDLLVGSTTHGILNRATCPVVIVPAVKSARKAAPRID